MYNHLSVFRSKLGEKQVLEAYESIMNLWPVPYEDLYIPTCLGNTHIILSGHKDSPPIILIHAFYASAASWFQTVGSLSKSYRVFAIDIIGDPNKSKPIKLIRQLSDFVDWFNDVMNELHLDQADFIGNSVGAFHIMNFALHATQRVRRMILIGPAATFLKITPFYFHTFPGGITGSTFLVRHAIRWIENEAPLDPKFHKLFYLIMKYGKSANQVFPTIFTDEQLKRITAPTLLLYGEKEIIYDYNLAIKRAEKYLKNIKTEIIPGANHLTAVSNPTNTNLTILDFLNTTN
jgi:pimeloyl-ACP methyl ester carboxylesterase